MAIKYSFVDSVLYGTDDVNDITRRLCGAGIAPFPSKDTYNVSDLNLLTAAVTEQGVSLDGCKCTARTENGENIIGVGQGVVFFQNGAALEVDADGYELRIPISSSGYVYAYFSTALQAGEIRFAELLPTDGFGVPLAQVRQDNSISDCRSFARSRLATLGKNAVNYCKFEKAKQPIEYEGMYIVQTLPMVNLESYTYAVINATTSGDEKEHYFPELGKYTAFWDNSLGKNVLILYTDGDGLHQKSEGYLYERNFSYGNKPYYVRMADGKLCIMCRCAEDEKELALSHVLPCTASLI